MADWRQLSSNMKIKREHTITKGLNMRQIRAQFAALTTAAALTLVWSAGGLLLAQAPPVRLNAAIDKLARGKSLAGAIAYDFSTYAAAQFAQSDLDFVILDMEHRVMDFERLESFLLASTNKAEIAKQGNLQVRVPPIVRIHVPVDVYSFTALLL